MRTARTPHASRAARSRRVALLAAAGLLVAACSGGGDITDSGEEPATTVSTVPGDTVAPTTTVAPDLLPDCPTDALASATGTTEIMFWHGMSSTLAEELQRLADVYNSSQSKVHVTLVGESYELTIDNYLQADPANKPDLVQLPEYMVQAVVDTESTVPVGKCIEASGFDTSAFLPTALTAYSTQGMQWGMPFNVSNPVLYYNKKAFVAAGLDPNKPPQSLEELREFSQQIVDSGAATYGLALDSGFDSGGGWYVEQWVAKAEEYYVDGDNGRTNRATQVLYNNDTGVELLTYMQDMINDGLAVSVGDNATGTDDLVKIADEQQPAAMAIHTSAALGGALDLLASGIFPQLSVDDLGIGPMPGPGGQPGALIGGASLWPVNSEDPVRIAAAWDFLTYLVGAQQQSEWAATTGYIPVRTDALELDPYKTTLATDPRFSVAYEQLLASPDALTSAGPVVGPLREMRSVLAAAISAIFAGADVKTTLDAAAEQANNLIADYNARNT
ncbi:MAG: ABC transporter substrate-binding protein [Actinomycetota bacterium]|nr:ABC transporter substrate-binding protein [Actinomycetota bacterium]